MVVQSRRCRGQRRASALFLGDAAQCGPGIRGFDETGGAYKRDAQCALVPFSPHPLLVCHGDSRADGFRMHARSQYRSRHSEYAAASSLPDDAPRRGTIRAHRFRQDPLASQHRFDLRHQCVFQPGFRQDPMGANSKTAFQKALCRSRNGAGQPLLDSRQHRRNKRFD